MSYASEEEKAAWKAFCEAKGDVPKMKAHSAYNAEQWKRDTPHTLIFHFETEEDLEDFRGYMSDGGGEYGFMEGNRHSDKYGFSFLYHKPIEGLDAREVKVIRLDREEA